MQVSVLGPVQVRSDDGSVVEIGGARVRMLLARLALERGRAVPVEALVDGLWGPEPPADAVGAVQALVSRLRRALGAAGTVELVAGGYRLGAGEGGSASSGSSALEGDAGGTVRGRGVADLDAERFEELVRDGRRELAAGGYAAAAATFDAAERLWRGAALADVREAPFARDAATRLDELRGAAAADRFEAELRLGRHDDALPGLEAAAAEQPLSERLAALRMRALAAAGRQADALRAYEVIRARLADELGIDPSAELREVHLALLRGELERPQARSAPAARGLPAQRTSFVGRADELRSLASQLDVDRLVTIVGPGGAGKTRLALEALSRAGGERVWFVPLAGVSVPEQLTDAVVGALNSLSSGPAATDPVDRLVELLDVGAAILLLDNCEHLIQAVAELTETLLDRLATLRIVATSREPLAITGEVLCHLGPLELPMDTGDPVAAAEVPAVRLFLDRARAVRPDFVLDAHTLAPVVEICRQLDGIPLALELAAAKLRAMSVEQIARRLGDRFRLLTSGSRTALPRQRTLEALVDWSWDLLTELEATLARRLSAFPGGANLEALETICADETITAAAVLDLIGALVEKSLVQSTGGADPRYGMLETIRAYAAARLAASGDDLTTRFAAHYLSVAEHNEPRLRTGAQLEAIAVFDAEHENMVAALRSRPVAENPALLSRFVAAMFWYWGIRGMSGQFETFVAAALHAGGAGAQPRADSSGRANELGTSSAGDSNATPGDSGVGGPRTRRFDDSGAVPEGRSSESPGRGVPGQPVADSRVTPGGFGTSQTDDSSVPQGDSGVRDPGVRRSDDSGDVAGPVPSALPEGDWNALRVVQLMAGSPVVDSGVARALVRDCLAGRALEYHPALPLWVLLLAYRADDPDLARAQLERALSWPDPWVRASAHVMRDFALTEGGDQPAGAHARREALREFEIVGDRWGLGMALLATGRDHSLRGEYDGAIASFERAARVAAELGTEDDITEARTALARERIRGGDIDGAARDIEAVRREAAERALPRMAAGILLPLAELQCRSGDTDGADHTLDRLATQVRRLPLPEPIAVDRIASARLPIRLAHRDTAGARELLPHAARGAFAQGHAAVLAETAEQLAQLLALEGDSDNAARALGVSEIIRGRFDDGEPRLRTLLADLTERLGDADFQSAYRRGSGMPRPDALRWLADMTGRSA